MKVTTAQTDQDVRGKNQCQAFSGRRSGNAVFDCGVPLLAARRHFF